MNTSLKINSIHIASKIGFGIIAFATLILSSCETTISPELEKVDPVLVVDAWINNKPGNQVISLTQTQPYFDNTLPPGVLGATVTVRDNKGVVFSFIEDAVNKGKYVWKPVGNQVFGTIGNSYKISIQVNGEVYEASSRMGRVPAVDSLTLKKNDSDQPNPDFYRAQFWGTDPIGSGDAYWIRAVKNGVLLNKPSDINVAYDAGFSAGGNFDGITFIPPIRGSVNPNDTDADDTALSPYAPGDSLYVEIHSITVPAFNYLQEVEIQTNRPGGFGELFARPINNVSTNIVNLNPKGKKAVGFFNVSAVSGRGKRFPKN
jgi:hypothetical protein